MRLRVSWGSIDYVTRPDTRPIPVADGWAGAEMRVFILSNSIITDQRTNGPTDQRSNGPIDGRTKPLIELLVCSYKRVFCLFSLVSFGMNLRQGNYVREILLRFGMVTYHYILGDSNPIFSQGLLCNTMDHVVHYQGCGNNCSQVLHLGTWMLLGIE